MILSHEAKNVIFAQAENGYPNECCGGLLGPGDAENGRLIELAIPVGNTFAPDEKYHRFQITADDVLALERTAREHGLELLGFYHSHPDHPAIPSEYDKNHAFPFYSYLIISVEHGQPAALLAWQLKDDRSAFEKEEWRPGPSVSA